MDSTNAVRDTRADFMRYAAKVKAAVSGRWPAILADLGVPESALRNQHGPCPGCGGRDRFRFDDRDGRGTFICGRGGDDELAGDGFALLEHAFGWPFPDALRRVGDLLHVPHPAGRVHVQAPLRPLPAAQDTAAPVRDSERAWRAINAVLKLTSDPTPCGPVAQYFAARGLTAISQDRPADLREARHLRYYREGGDWTEHPAMVAVVRAVGGELLTLHRIYLNTCGGKADVPNPKRLMTPVVATWLGGAVQLYAPTDRLALAEGIESALAVRLLTGWPVWACVTAGGLEAVRIPDAVRRIAIHADHDTAGLAAADRLRNRLAADGCEVGVVVPPERGMDPLDVLAGACHG